MKSHFGNRIHPFLTNRPISSALIPHLQTTPVHQMTAQQGGKAKRPFKEPAYKKTILLVGRKILFVHPSFQILRGGGLLFMQETERNAEVVEKKHNIHGHRLN